jgi:hypothetical protein
MAGTQPNHFVTGRKDSVKTVAPAAKKESDFEKAKREGRVKEASVGSAAATIARTVVAVAKQGSKFVKKVYEESSDISKAEQRAKELKKTVLKNDAPRAVPTKVKTSKGDYDVKEVSKNAVKITKKGSDKGIIIPKTQSINDMTMIDARLATKGLKGRTSRYGIGD